MKDRACPVSSDHEDDGRDGTLGGRGQHGGGPEHGEQARRHARP